MLYYANPSTPSTREAMAAGHLGAIITPAQGNRVPPGVRWVADNGCGPGRGGIGAGYPGDGPWLAWVASLDADPALCGFVVAPDVVGDAAATLARSAPFLPAIRAAGYPAAFVAQNGLEDLDVPWSSFDVLFIGGDTAWKLGPAARGLVAEAFARGKRVHMGRVNSLRRMRYAAAIGCHSVDGTFLAFGPDRNLPELLGWVRDAHDAAPLFSVVG